jgi:monothiol glutaredoxin
MQTEPTTVQTDPTDTQTLPTDMQTQPTAMQTDTQTEPGASQAQPTSAGDSNPIRDAIAEAIGEHKVILFMKGTPEAPACGFSARTVAALQALDAPFAAVDVLPDPRIRQELSSISNWPTIPQLFANGELIGGCDIVTEMFESGELAEALQ